MGNVRIVIADDHSVVRMGIAALFSAEPDFEIAGQARNGIEAVRLAKELKPDVLVMDLMMPRKDGVEATKEIKAAVPGTKILILTSFATSDVIKRAIDAGADGAILKNAENNDLVKAVRQLFRGRTAISSDVKRLLASEPPITELSPRQEQILQAIVRGLTNQDIATLLGISIPSVKTHVTALFEKIGAANRAEAVDIAHRRHLLKI